MNQSSPRPKIEHWRTTQNDPHGIATAVYAALCEVADAVKNAK